MAGEQSHERYAFSPRWHRAAVVYLVASVPVAFGLGLLAEGREQYLTVWAAMAALHVGPAAICAPRALRLVSRCDRMSWKLWSLGWLITYASNGVIYLVAVRGWDQLRYVPIVLAVGGIAAVATGNSLILHRLSGQRALLLDVVDLVMATVAIVGPVALLTADVVVGAPDRWYTVTGGLVVIGMVHEIASIGAIHVRVAPEWRGPPRVALLFGVVAIADAVGMVAQGATEFTLPSAPLVAIHGACMSGAVLLAAFTLRQLSPGLSRLAPQHQVRKNGPLAGLLLTSVVLVAATTWWRRDETWVVVTALALLGTLVLLSAVRQLYLGRETVRLYAEVERAADERRDLLAEVLRHVDTDRHSAAAQLHRQAASLYTAVATFAEANRAARRVRFDIARQVEATQQILAAMRSDAPDHEGTERLVTLTRAYLGNLYGDMRRPALDVSVEERLWVDWTHEVVVFRIVQMAVHNIWRHAEASSIGLAMSARDGALTVEVSDDGIGFEPEQVVLGNGIVTMHALAAYVDGRVEIDSSPGGGTRVCAVVGGPAPPPPPPPAPSRPDGRPALRLVTSSSAGTPPTDR